MEQPDGMDYAACRGQTDNKWKRFDTAPGESQHRKKKKNQEQHSQWIDTPVRPTYD